MTTLLVASSGGHLTQLHQLRPRLAGLADDVRWVTFDTPQSRSLLAGENVVYVSHTGTRDYRAVVSNTRAALRLLRRQDVGAVVSTGAGIALSFLPAARALRIPAYYVESATRSDGPSLTGRLLQKVPGVQLYTQHESWEDDRWRFAGSVFDGYVVRVVRDPQIRKVVVSLGAHETYGFRRLVETLRDLLPADAEVLWQTGSTDVSGLGVDARAAVPAFELRAAMAKADVVVAHAGTGAALSALEVGRVPLLVPRDPRYGEHVDDHQQQIAADLSSRGLAVARRVEDLSPGDLQAAAALRAVRLSQPPPFAIGGAGARLESARHSPVSISAVVLGASHASTARDAVLSR